MKKRTLLIAIVMVSILIVNQGVYAGELGKESEDYTYEPEKQEKMEQNESLDVNSDESDKNESPDITSNGSDKSENINEMSKDDLGELEQSMTNEPAIQYQTHVQSYGWQDWVNNGELSGTTGKSKRLEAIRISIHNQLYSGDIQYRTHIQSYGWEKDWKTNGEMSGTSGQAKRLEAIQIQLTGELAERYDIYYRVHAQHFGWLDWAKNGENAGTAGYSYRLEGIEIQLIKKGESAPGKEENPYYQTLVSYQTHVQSYGWQTNKTDGETAGTTGKSKRLEGIRISLQNQLYSGDIQYRTHIQTYGWEKEWKTNGEMSGTSGQAKRLEAIQIQLTGEMQEHYDVYYRVHAQHYGWLGWAKNGENAGTAGYGYRLEGIQIVLIKKGGDAPGSTEHSFYHYNSWVSGLKTAKDTSQLIVVSVGDSNYATVSMHTKDAEGYWSDNYKVSGRVGKNGIGKTKEGDKKTPIGVYSFGQAFGIASNPGTTKSYLKVNNNHYWVSDSNSVYYNQLVDISKTGKKWNSAEHLISYTKAYKYAVALNFNTNHEPGAGSAIFLHCNTGNATGGCIAIDEKYMIYTLKNLKNDAKIIIDYSNKIKEY